MNNSKTNVVPQPIIDLSNQLNQAAEEAALFRSTFNIDTYPLLTETEFANMAQAKFEQTVKEISEQPVHHRADHIAKAQKWLKIATQAAQLEQYARLSDLHTVAKQLTLLRY